MNNKETKECHYCVYLVFGFVLLDLAIVFGTMDAAQAASNLAAFANWLFN